MLLLHGQLGCRLCDLELFVECWSKSKYHRLVSKSLTSDIHLCCYFVMENVSVVVDVGLLHSCEGYNACCMFTYVCIQCLCVCIW